MIFGMINGAVLTSLDARRLMNEEQTRPCQTRRFLHSLLPNAVSVLSHNRRHLIQLHRRSTAAHNAMVLCTFDPDFIRQARRLHQTISSVSEIFNQVIRVVAG